jgi:hypothetical protein
MEKNIKPHVDWDCYSDEDLDEEIPDLELDEVRGSPLVSADTPSSLEFARKDNLHAPNRAKRS